MKNNRTPLLALAVAATALALMGSGCIWMGVAVTSSDDNNSGGLGAMSGNANLLTSAAPRGRWRGAAARRRGGYFVSVGPSLRDLG